MNEEYFTFHLQYKHSGTFANRKCEELFFTPKIRKCATPFQWLHRKCDPILVNPDVTMRPHPAAHPHQPLIRKYLPGMTYTRDWTEDSYGLRKYTSIIRYPVIIKILFCSENGIPASFSTRALPSLRFLVAILENEKNLSGNCLGTNLESLESLNNIYPRSFHSVVWKEKKLTRKNYPLLKLAHPL